MDKALVKKYVAIREKREAIEAEEMELKSQILDNMVNNKIEKFESEYGNFTRSVKVSWKYSDKVADLKDKMKIREVYEQEKGIATSTETEYIMFKQNKNE